MALFNFEVGVGLQNWAVFVGRANWSQLLQCIYLLGFSFIFWIQLKQNSKLNFRDLDEVKISCYFGISRFFIVCHWGVISY